LGSERHSGGTRRIDFTAALDPRTRFHSNHFISQSPEALAG